MIIQNMEQNKPQIIYIQGGDAFENKEDLYASLRSRSYDIYAPERATWKTTLFINFADTHFCYRPSMPNPWWANYEAWKIWFEKMVPQFNDGLILIGHSLGGGFLLRYLSENQLPVLVAQLHLVAPVVDAIACEDIGEFKIDLATWSGFATDIKAVHLWHSSDDTLVPIHHSERFQAVYPAATLHRFTNRGHFLQESFLELEAVIKLA